MSDKPSEATTGEPSAAIRDLCGAHGQQTRPTHSCICLKLLTVRYAERERLRGMAEDVTLSLTVVGYLSGLSREAEAQVAALVADLRAGKEG